MPDAAPDIRSTAHVDRAHATVGCLLGTAVGDALGLAVEGLSARRQARMYPQLDNYHFLFGRGCISDDTEHTCMLAQALIVSLDEDTERFGRKFGSSLGWRLRFWFLGLPAGMGLATGRAIIKLWLGFPARLSGVRSAGNGPAMRAALLGVCFDDRDQLHVAVRAGTQVTHRHPDAFDGALLVALAAQVSASHENIKPARFLAMARAHLPAQSALIVDLTHVVNSIGVGEQTAEFIAGLGCKNGVTGYIRHTVPAALHVWLTCQNDYEQAVLRTIHLGGDTDTCAAIVGAIVGARVGEAGIPAQWLDGLCEWPRSVSWMRRLGQRLATQVAVRGRGKALPLNVMAVLLRNVLFLVVVLLHGFRRLAPPY